MADYLSFRISQTHGGKHVSTLKFVLPPPLDGGYVDFVPTFAAHHNITLGPHKEEGKCSYVRHAPSSWCLLK